MSTLLSLVVVGASIGVIARSLARELSKPATDDAPSQRATAEEASEKVTHIRTAPPPTPAPVRVAVVAAYPPEVAGSLRWWERARSGVALAGVLAGLGVGLAITVALVFFAGFSAIRDALG